MKINRRLLTFLLPILMITFIGITLNAASDNKPDTHTTAWEAEHGKAYKADEAECMNCHEDRILCITCHEDTKPRNHNMAFVQRTHGLESRWNRQDCTVCHKEDFCISCHQSSLPMNHTRANFRGPGTGSHCQTSCQLPFGSWQQSPSKNCTICHQTRPTIRTTGAPHQMN